MANLKISVIADNLASLLEWVKNVSPIEYGRPRQIREHFLTSVIIDAESLDAAERFLGDHVRIQKITNISDMIGGLLQNQARGPVTPGLANGFPYNSFSTPAEIHQKLQQAVSIGGRAELFQLPNKSHLEINPANNPYGIRLGGSLSSSIPTVLLMGGVHGSELTPPEVLCRLPYDLLNSYSGGFDLRYANLVFSGQDIRAMLNQINIVIVPVINPDGRAITMRTQGQALHRKNGYNYSSDSDQNGVDVNRNFDFLWQAEQYFDPAVLQKHPQIIGLKSTDSNYRGATGAVSEPETKNAVWLLDTFKNIRWLIDIHSWTDAPIVVYNWGDDHDGTDASHIQQYTQMNGKKAIGAGSPRYFEYVKQSDFTLMKALAEKTAEYANRVRALPPNEEVDWKSGQSWDGIYPTCASSDDYAFSRHLTGLPKVYGYTMELGADVRATWADTTQLWLEMAGGLVGFLIEFSRCPPTAWQSLEEAASR